MVFVEDKRMTDHDDELLPGEAAYEAEDVPPADSEEDHYEHADHEPKKYKSWIDQPCYSIAHLNLPKVEKVEVKK